MDDNGICNPPVVLCDGAVSGRVGEAVSLSATAIDLDGTIVSNQWIVVIKPMGSTAQPMPNNQVTASFTPDVAGRYVLRTVFEIEDVAMIEAVAAERWREAEEAVRALPAGCP